MQVDNIRAYDFEFRAVDDEGAYCRYEALFAFDEPESGRCYLVYCDASADDEGELATYASVALDPAAVQKAQDQVDAGSKPKKPPLLELAAFESQDEWDLVDQAFEELENEDDD